MGSDKDEHFGALITQRIGAEKLAKAGKFSDKGDGFDVIVDGTTYSNPFFTDCHACGANFPGFWAALRKANNLQISAEGKTVKLPTKNLKKVLLPYSDKQNICRSAW